MALEIVNNHSSLGFDSNTKTEFGWLASNLKKTKLSKYKMLTKIRDEIPTLNRFGYMKIDLDEFTESFINYSVAKGGMSLELGTAYGFVVLEALKIGAKIIANDISSEHLSVLLSEAPEDKLENLFLYPARFPNEIVIPSGSLTAVLSSRMLHFLDIEEIQEGLKSIHNWLVPEGNFYFISVTPYHASLRDKFLTIYKQREANGEKWPGRIESQWEIAPQHESFVPEFLHVFDIPKLEELLPEYGFKIEKISLFDYPNDFDSAGKGHVGLIATKV